MRKIHLLFIAILMLFATQAYPDTIATSLPVDTSSSFGGFWLGTIQFNDGITYIVSAAQKFSVTNDYTAISAELLLAGSYWNDPLNVAVSLTGDSGGLPGTVVLAASNISTTQYWPLIYNVAFPGITLMAGQAYWLIATSDAYENDNVPPGNYVIGDTPVWVSAQSFSLPVAYIHGPVVSPSSWEIVDNATLAFSVSGNPVPEPTTMLLLGLGLVGLAGVRRKMK
jgi:hypothetical protein